VTLRNHPGYTAILGIDRRTFAPLSAAIVRSPKGGATAVASQGHFDRDAFWLALYDRFGGFAKRPVARGQNWEAYVEAPPVKTKEEVAAEKTPEETAA
jgi:hypothetical protein